MVRVDSAARLKPPVGTMQNNKEAQLISQARDGDVSSFSALVEIYQERAVHVAMSFLGNVEDAKDCAQDAFVKAYFNLKSFKAESQFYTWFCRILINQCKDFLRKKMVRRAFSFWNNEESDLADLIESKEKNAEEITLSAELGQTIYTAISTLPFQQQSAFTLRYLEGLSLEEISEVMNLNLGTVKAHLWQAVQKMRKKLSALKSEEVENG